VIKTPDGKTLGKHDGLMFYTIGQRKGLRIGGCRDAIHRVSEHLPWYVVGKNIPANELIVAQGHDHPLLFSSELICEKLHWISLSGARRFTGFLLRLTAGVPLRK